jgi:hypothetical protein
VATQAQIQAYIHMDDGNPPRTIPPEANALVRAYVLTQGPIKALDEALRNARYVRLVP